MAERETREPEGEDIVSWGLPQPQLSLVITFLMVILKLLTYLRYYKKKRKDSAGSDDTASMIKGGGYLGARTRQPPTAQTNKLESNVGQGGCVP